MTDWILDVELNYNEGASPSAQNTLGHQILSTKISLPQKDKRVPFGFGKTAMTDRHMAVLRPLAWERKKVGYPSPGKG